MTYQQWINERLRVRERLEENTRYFRQKIKELKEFKNDQSSLQRSTIDCSCKKN